jgi:hypothetical protein
MLEVANEKLTERERECVKHFRQAQGKHSANPFLRTERSSESPVRGVIYS